MNKDKHNLKDELKDIAPDFPLAGDKEIYTVPNLYFETLKQQIIDQTIDANNEVEEKGNDDKPVFRLKNYWRYAAAASIMLIIGFYFLLGIDSASTERYALNANDGIQYILDNLDELDESMVNEIANMADVDFSEAFIPEVQIEEMDLEFELDDILEGFEAHDIDNLFEDIN